MNIAMILDEEFPPDPRVQNEANSLLDAGHSILLFCFDYQNKPEKETINGIRVHRLKVPKFIYSLSSLAYSFPFYRWFIQPKLKDFFSRETVDAVHVHDMRIAKTVLRALPNENILKILDLHENRPEIMKYYEHVRRFPGNILISPKKWKNWEKKLVKKYDKVVVVTNEAKEYLVNSYLIPEEKIAVFPNTVHPSFYSDYEVDKSLIKRLEKNFVLFYLGETGKRRGLETAVKAVELLKNSISEILLVIAGKSKYDRQLKKLVLDLNVNEHVSFEGFQDMKKVPSYILASKICISPLHRNIHHDTTYANKIFQYMSLGVPVLVSDCVAQKNVVEKAHAGLVHEAENEKDFAKKVFYLFHNPDEAKKMGENGKNFIQTVFNQDITSGDLVNLYSSLSVKN
jgi:glycosyltransferase involved in cell wall biosynthesis